VTEQINAIWIDLSAYNVDRLRTKNRAYARHVKREYYKKLKSELMEKVKVNFD